MAATDELVRNNEAYAAEFDKGELSSPPAKAVAIVTCMDARIDAHRIMGLGEGDAHVIRNAGGVVTDDVIRSLTISQRKLGTQEVMLVMHTKCGMNGLSDAEFADELESDAGERPSWPARGFSDLEQALRDGVAKLRANPFLAHTTAIRGFVYDVETGNLREVA
jgi:carbonic anhydrase